MSLFWKIREKVTPIMTSNAFESTSSRSSCLMSLPCRFELQDCYSIYSVSPTKGPQPPQPTSGFHNLQFPNTKKAMAADSKHEAQRGLDFGPSEP